MKPLSLLSYCFSLVIALVLMSCHSDSSSDTPSSSAHDQAPRAAGSSVPAPTIEGPISGGLRGKHWGGAVASQSPLEEYGYLEEEYFFSGSAERRALDGSPAGGRAEYTTRMLIARPSDSGTFNGTVILEWFNVTAEMDLPLMWMLGHEEIMRSGFIYVGVSAQAVGVSDSPTSLKAWDPVRYAPLAHPGDAYAHDMFSQSARALVSYPRLLGEMVPKRIIATGESQSCSYLAQYANVVQPEQQVMDGFLLHSCASFVSDAIGVPTLLFLTESEIDGFTAADDGSNAPPEQLADIPGLGIFRLQMLKNGFSPQTDGERYRVWEIAGGSHYDKQSMEYLIPFLQENLAAPLDVGILPETEWELACFTEPNQLAMERPTRAAIRQMHAWVSEEVNPPSYMRIAKGEDGSIIRDERGIAVGGIRMPPMVAADGVNVGDDCPFIGSYTPGGDADRQQTYASQQDFLNAVTEAAINNINEGTLIGEDASLYSDDAADVSAWD